ncbi:hypothetical protein REPUB_Repub20aG0080700 [Reevesia pubescens]
MFFLYMQKIVIKVSMNCRKCRTKALRIAAAVDGVTSLALDGPENDKLMIEGDGVDAACLTASLRKKLCHASLELVEEVKEKEIKPQKPPIPTPTKPNPNPNPTPTKPNPNPNPTKPNPNPNPIVCCQHHPPVEYYRIVVDPPPAPCTIM